MKGAARSGFILNFLEQLFLVFGGSVCAYIPLHLSGRLESRARVEGCLFQRRNCISQTTL